MVIKNLSPTFRTIVLNIEDIRPKHWGYSSQILGTNFVTSSFYILLYFRYICIRVKHSKIYHMIKQDYLIRMIQEIITLLVNALLNRQKIRKESWVEYDDITRQILGIPSENLKDTDAEEIINRYTNDPNQMGKIELAAMTMLKIADEMDNDHLVMKSKLKQEGITLLEHVQTTGNTFSLQRVSLIAMLKK